MADDMPTAVHQGELKIGSVTLRTYVLDDGRRIINADDTARLFASWGAGESLSSDDARTMTEFLRGKDQTR